MRKRIYKKNITLKDLKHLESLIEHKGHCVLEARDNCRNCILHGLSNFCSFGKAYKSSKRILKRLTEEDKLEILVGGL
jgi:hypothetical protein